MSREWKPGDVGITGNSFGGETPTRFLVTKNELGARRFIYADGDMAGFPPRQDARLLVVIDYEDREAVRSLLDAYWVKCSGEPGVGEFPQYVNDMQAALREFANPSPAKPDEPTGFGAVVLDSKGDLWVRAKSTTTVRHWRNEKGGDRKRYDDIAVISVMSHGVEPMAEWERDLLSEGVAP